MSQYDDDAATCAVCGDFVPGCYACDGMKCVRCERDEEAWQKAIDRYPIINDCDWPAPKAPAERFEDGTKDGTEEKR